MGIHISDLVSQDAHMRVKDKARRTVNQPMHIEGNSINLDCSIGTALFPGDGQDTDKLIQTSHDSQHQQQTA